MTTRTTRILVGTLIAILVLYFIITEVAHGAVGINRELPFYGVLNDDKGKPLTGTYDMVFKIYDASSGGSVLWTGTSTGANGNAVTVTDGEFSVMLGSGTGNALSLDFNDDSYYLGITIEDDPEMTPREHLGASGYAINSDLLDGLNSSDFLQSNSLININDSTTTSLLTLKQSGGGDYFTIFNDSDAEIFSVRNSGEVYATSIEVVDNAHFNSDVLIADGSGLIFGGGNGIALSQNMSMASDLLLTPSGEVGDGYIRIVAPKALSIHANMDRTDSGDEQPAIEMNTNGLMRIYNLSVEPGDSPRLELSFMYGTEITEGGLLVSNGGITVTDYGIDVTSGDIQVLTGTTTTEFLRIPSLAGNGETDIAVDDNGNVVLSGTSDEQFKQNIRTFDNALDTLLRLRGVRYEWKDPERFGEQIEIGFIAQEVQEVVPEVVRDNGDYLRINTKNLLAVVVEAIKELYKNVEEYMNRTERLEQEVEVLRAEIEILKGSEVESTPEQEENNNEEVIVNVDENIVEDVPQPPVESVEDEIPSEPVPGV